MCKQDFVSCMMCWSTGGPERFGSSPACSGCSSLRASKIPKEKSSWQHWTKSQAAKYTNLSWLWRWLNWIPVSYDRQMLLVWLVYISQSRLLFYNWLRKAIYLPFENFMQSQNVKMQHAKSNDELSGKCLLEFGPKTWWTNGYSTRTSSHES